MSFKTVQIPFHINTTTCNPVDVLFNPLLHQAHTYDVAVGYFSTSWIRDAAAGIAALVSNGGRSRWVINPSLSKHDWELLSKTPCAEERQKIVENAAQYDYLDLQRRLEHDTRITLAWLIRDGVIAFQIAIPKNELTGIFHAKLGILTDPEGNKVAFSGSYNLTGAANTNWETIDVYLSWEPAEAKRVAAKEAEFERIWKKEDPNLAVYKPTDKLVAKFVEITEHTRRPYILKNGRNTSDKPTLWIPAHFLDGEGKLRKHQESAIQTWFKNNGRGIFQMATGSGKTVTALAVATKLALATIKLKKKLIVLVTVPYKHLAEQWEKEASAFGFEPLICYENFEFWAQRFHQKLLDLTLGTEEYVFLITVNATFSNERFQSLLAKIDSTFLFIADEMHNMGGEKLRTQLPENALFRLGLSATPDRHNDDAGTQIIRNYFGPVAANYGISEAIEDGTLTPYYYYPVLVEFTDDEMERYQELSIRIAKLMAQGSNSEDEPSGALKFALLERARMIGGAENKLPTLRSLISERRDSKYNLVYCGDTITDDVRSIDRVVKVIGNDVGMRINCFTNLESSKERREILERFGSGELQVLAAIRCLDEGVDVPRTETAYILASTANPRQYIQRRGRVLRRAAGKHHASIYDFIVVPPSGKHLDASTFNVERRLVKKELERVDEFASTSVNAGDALQALRAIKIRLNLLDS